MNDVVLEQIMRMAAANFSMESCTDESIDKFLDMVESKIEQSGVSRDDIHDEITRRHNVSMLGDAAILDDRGDHAVYFLSSFS